MRFIILFGLLASAAVQAQEAAIELPRLIEQRQFQAKPGSMPSGAGLSPMILPVTVIAFDVTFHERRVQDDLDLFNAIFAPCAIQLGSVPVRIFNSEGRPLTYKGNGFGSASWADARWGQLQRAVMDEGIVATYLSYNDRGKGPIPQELGSSQNLEREGVSWRTDELKARALATFPKYAFYLTDCRHSLVAPLHEYADCVPVFSHEAGHILFSEGHNEQSGNLMFGFKKAAGPTRRSGATAVTADQCAKARKFIEKIR